MITVSDFIRAKCALLDIYIGIAHSYEHCCARVRISNRQAFVNVGEYDESDDFEIPDTVMEEAIDKLLDYTERHRLIRATLR